MLVVLLVVVLLTFIIINIRYIIDQGGSDYTLELVSTGDEWGGRRCYSKKFQSEFHFPLVNRMNSLDGIQYHRYIPTEDLVNIYHLYYGDDRVTADMITSCSSWMYLARYDPVTDFI